MKNNCNIPNPNRNIRDDLGQSHKCQKCKTVKLILTILALFFAFTTIALLVSSRTIYVNAPVIEQAISLQSSSQNSSASVSSEPFESIKGETVRTGGQN